MNIYVRHKEEADSKYVIEIGGTLDYSTMDECQENLYIPEGVTQAVVNLSNLDFIDSTGIGAVLSLIYSANESQVAISLEGLNSEIRELFDTIGVFKVIQHLSGEGGA